MAIYPIYNPETGEKKIIEMSVHKISEWYENNKPWIRDWNEGCASVGEVGDWRDKMSKTHPGWGDIMKNKVAKAPGSRVQW